MQAWMNRPLGLAWFGAVRPYIMMCVCVCVRARDVRDVTCVTCVRACVRARVRAS